MSNFTHKILSFFYLLLILLVPTLSFASSVSVSPDTFSSTQDGVVTCDSFSDTYSLFVALSGMRVLNTSCANDHLVANGEFSPTLGTFNIVECNSSSDCDNAITFTSALSATGYVGDDSFIVTPSDAYFSFSNILTNYSFQLFFNLTMIALVIGIVTKFMRNPSNI